MLPAGVQDGRARLCEPGVDMIERLAGLKRVREDARIRGQPNKREQTDPGERERLRARKPLLQPRARPGMIRRRSVIGVQEQVDVGELYLRSSSLRIVSSSSSCPASASARSRSMPGRRFNGRVST